MKKAFRLLFQGYVGITLLFSLSAHAAQPLTNEAKLKRLLERTTSLDQVYFMMAFTGANKDSLRAIHVDIMKNGGEKRAFPKLSLVENEFQVNGRVTGMKLASFEPLKINYRGQSWTYSPDQSMDKNYFALKSLLQQKPQASASFFFPEAYALNPVDPNGFRDEAIVGSVAVGMTGTLVCIEFVPCEGLMWTGSLVGGAVGVKDSAQSADATLDQDTPRVKVVCSADSVSVSSTAQGAFKISKTSDGSIASVQRLTPKAGWSDASKEASNDPDFTALAKCGSPADALQLEDKLNASRDAAIFALTGKAAIVPQQEDSAPAVQ